MNTGKFLLAITLCSSMLLAEATESVKLSSTGTKDHPFIMDLAKNQTITVATEAKDVYGKFTSMVPSLRDSYIIDLTESQVSFPPLTFPKKEKPAKGKSECNLNINNTIQSINKATKETDVSTYVIELKQLILNAPQNCSKEIEIAKNTINKTEMTFETTLKANSRIDITVTRPGYDGLLSKATFTTEKKEWMTHVGFTFIKNKDERYYSKKINDTNFVIAEQNSNSDFKHAASVLFTYPVYEFGEDFDLGLTAGLGATVDTVQVTTGLSFIVAENFLITLGATIMNFDKLKGIHEKGQDIGKEAIDSSNLIESQLDYGFSITFGYRFN